MVDLTWIPRNFQAPEPTVTKSQLREAIWELARTNRLFHDHPENDERVSERESARRTVYELLSALPIPDGPDADGEREEDGE